MTTIGGFACGGRGATALPGECGGRGATALPVRKRLNHRGPLSIDVSYAWYYITICAECHEPWVADMSRIRGMDGRAVAPRPPNPVKGESPVMRDGGDRRFAAVTPLDEIAPLILHEARETHARGIWRLALFLVMPDHLHFIAQFPGGGRGATALPRVIANFKHLLSVRYGMKFQRDFFDTRLRDDAHFAEKFGYICGNPVRKGLCEEPSEWPYSIKFERNGNAQRGGGRGATALPGECGGRGETALPDE